MSEDLYRCVCHTCGTERLVEGLEDAQAFFNRHAERTHEVELLNQQTRCRYSNASSAGENETDDSIGDATDTDVDEA
ncbi:hypothetical protein [Haloterrigena salinisoli]|uniref:hypothetical protein n=1 Tax=Haloterrigena salinisoli TaxID=3132747 RepID=UPI0030D45846